MFKNLNIFGKIPAEDTMFYLCYTNEKIYGLNHNTCLTWISRLDEITGKDEVVPGIIVNYIMDITNFTDYETFVIMHEIGHYANGHIGTKESVKKKLFPTIGIIISMLNRKVENEYVADEYAVDILNKEAVLKGLNEMLSVKGINKREIEKRIVNIESKF